LSKPWYIKVRKISTLYTKTCILSNVNIENDDATYLFVCLYVGNLSMLKESIEVLSKINYKPQIKLPVKSIKPSFPESPVVIWIKQGTINCHVKTEIEKSISRKL
jgi:hypothetical protein